MQPVIVAGADVSRFGRFVDTPLDALAQPVILNTLRDAGIAAADVQAAFVGNGFGGLVQGQETMLGQLLLTAAGLDGVPVHNVKNACSSGSNAVALAWASVAHGQHDCVLVVGAEKMTHSERGRAVAALASASDRLPAGLDRSVFMDLNAERARRYMRQYGAEVRQFAQCAVKNRRHAALNPNAAEHAPLTVEGVLADRVVVEPLTRSMCGGIADGAAALVLVSERWARRKGITAPRIVASALVGGRPSRTLDQPSATARAAAQAFESAGIDPREVSLAEVHDPTAPQEFLDIEDLGLCGRGEAIAWLERGDTSLGGRLPVNVSGGLAHRGHPVGATGVAQIVELTRQLAQRAGASQVDRARVGVAQMAGGVLGNDSAVATVHVLAA